MSMARPDDFARNVIIAGGSVLLGALAVLALLLGGALRLPAAVAVESGTPPITIDRMMLPIVAEGGTLHGYTVVDMAIDTPPDRRAFVQGRLPLVRHAINLVAWETPVVRANDPAKLDIAAMQKMLTRAAREATAVDAVRGVQVRALKSA